MKELIERAMVIAKRKHVCSICSKDIEVGKSYQKELFKKNNRFFIRKTCLECLEKNSTTP